ncbi:hypothetical protein D3C86_2256240 [compost metagenome]
MEALDAGPSLVLGEFLGGAEGVDALVVVADPLLHPVHDLAEFLRLGGTDGR